MSRLASDLSTQLGYDRIVTRHWPQANGVCENANIFLGQALRLLPNDRRRHWDRYTARLGFVVNSTVSSATTFSPNQLDNGSEANDIFSSILSPPLTDLTVSQLQNEKHYTDLTQTLRTFHQLAVTHSRSTRAEANMILNAKGKPKSYNIGDTVVVYVPATPLTESKSKELVLEKGWKVKHLNQWRGPCTIVEKPSPQSYVLREVSTGTIFNRTVANLRKYELLTDFRTFEKPAAAEIFAPKPLKTNPHLFVWNEDTMDTLKDEIVLIQELDVYWIAQVTCVVEGGVNLVYYSTQGKNLKKAKFFVTYIEQGTNQVILGKPKPSEKADLWTGFAPFEDIKVRCISINKTGTLQATSYGVVAAYQKKVDTHHACL
jgi:hypothetical protein